MDSAKECFSVCVRSSEKEDSNKKGRIATGDIKKCCTTGKVFRSLATKWHPNKAEMNRLCALVEDKCLNYFKNLMFIGPFIILIVE